MAITKQLSIGSASKIRNTLNYVMRADKTESILVSGIECNPDTAAEEFELVKTMHGKSDGLVGHHVIQSFMPGELASDVAHQIGIQLAKEIAPGFQVVLATHYDRDHLHNHLVINSVHPETGQKYYAHLDQYDRIRTTSDRLCEENGLSVIFEPMDRGWNQETYQTALRGESWKVRLMKTIDEAKATCKNRYAFVGYMESMGYEVKWQNRNVSFRDPDHNKFIRGKTLGKDYTKEAIEYALESGIDKSAQDADRSDGRTSGATIESSRDVAWDERRNEPSDAQSDSATDRTAAYDPSRIGDDQGFIESQVMGRLSRVIRTDSQGEDTLDEQIRIAGAFGQMLSLMNRDEGIQQKKMYSQMKVSGEPIMFGRLSMGDWNRVKGTGLAVGFLDQSEVLVAYLQKDHEKIKKQLDRKLELENRQSQKFREEVNITKHHGLEK